MARQAIEASFPVLPLPEQADVDDDHCPECQQLAAWFAVRPWADLQVADLRHNPSLTLLTPRLFRHYLPAFLLRSMEGHLELDRVPYGLVAALSPPGGKPGAFLRAWSRDLNGDQVAAILAFLRHYEAIAAQELRRDERHRRVVARAIRYWSALASPPATQVR